MKCLAHCTSLNNASKNAKCQAYCENNYVIRNSQCYYCILLYMDVTFYYTRYNESIYAKKKQKSKYKPPRFEYRPNKRIRYNLEDKIEEIEDVVYNIIFFLILFIPTSQIPRTKKPINKWMLFVQRSFGVVVQRPRVFKKPRIRFEWRIRLFFVEVVMYKSRFRLPIVFVGLPIVLCIFYWASTVRTSRCAIWND